MSDYGKLNTTSVKAAGDLSALQYHLMRYSGVNEINVASDAVNEAAAGVLINKPAAANRAATLAGAGSETKIVAGGTLTVNDLITCNGSGRAAAATSGDFVFGRVLETANADGDIVRALLSPFQFTDGPA